MPVHAVLGATTAIVLVVTAVLGVFLVLVRSWRWVLRRPFGVMAPVSFVLLFATRHLGTARGLERLHEGGAALTLSRHMTAADLTMLAAMALLLLGWFACFTLGGESPRLSGYGAHEGREIPSTPLLNALLLITCVATVACVVATVTALR